MGALPPAIRYKSNFITFDEGFSYLCPMQHWMMLLAVDKEEATETVVLRPLWGEVVLEGNAEGQNH